MDKSLKKDSLCYQVLFNKPLFMKPENKYIYGFRVLINEVNKNHFTDKELMQYAVEQVFGKCLFQTIHDGSFEGDKGNIWIDREGNEYKYGIQTRQYSYDATVENMMNFRYDLVYACCENEEGDNYWITDPAEYFESRAMMDEDDHKLGRNQWMENFYRIRSRRSLLSSVIVRKSDTLITTCK